MASAGTLSSACLYRLWLRKHVISCYKWATPPGPELQLYFSELAVFFSQLVLSRHKTVWLQHWWFESLKRAKE